MIHYETYDNAEMSKVARLVIRLNPYAKGYTAAQIESAMRGAASELWDGNGYIAMGGWQVSAYRDSEGRARIKPSIAAHCFDDCEG